MNKRQKKKVEARMRTFSEFGKASYRHNKEIERQYHEYMVIAKRRCKKCVDCEYFYGLDLCERHIFFLPCVKEKAV